MREHSIPGMDAVIIEAEALRLPESQRALLADRLLESISRVSPRLKEAWIHEADDRMQAFRDGQLSAVDGPKAMDELRRRFTA
jgi:hypothetical protein